MDAADALRVERGCAVTAVALSHGRRQGARLVSGERRSFGLARSGAVVHVPHPAPDPAWTRRTITCGVALQCAPSKDRLGRLPLRELTVRELRALAIVEGGVAAGWVAACWPGLLPEIRRWLPDLELLDPELSDEAILRHTVALAGARRALSVAELLGRAPAPPGRAGAAAGMRLMYGRMPWTSTRRAVRRGLSIPVGGDGGMRNPNPPPASRPEDDDLEIDPRQRAGIPYPEWNVWRRAFQPDHVAVLERRTVGTARAPGPGAAELRRWFQQRTDRAMTGGLDDGCDLDVERYLAYYTDAATGTPAEPRVFRDLRPAVRDVATALLLDGSSSLGAQSGRVFRLELACADALSRAMTAAQERHGVFVFSGDTRHRVEVRCLKDFSDRHLVLPSTLGLTTGGYTRLGAPLRHLTRRLLAQPALRRLLIVVGDGLMSDEGYEGRYAFADVAHAVAEAAEAGVAVYYVGVGPTRVDPLPEVFGPRRSQRIRRVEELPRVLARVHRELVNA